LWKRVKNKNMEKINEVYLFEQEDDKNSFLEWVSILDDERLSLNGNDCGEIPLRFWGDIDYEYWRIIDKDWKDTILLLLIKDMFKRFNDFAGWLEEKNIPSTFGSYV
jgi:hypothetical protein